jgi:hypothetical protein
MHAPRLFRHASPEVFFGVFHTLVWLLLALQLSAGVLTPLAQSLDALEPGRAAVE